MLRACKAVVICLLICEAFSEGERSKRQINFGGGNKKPSKSSGTSVTFGEVQQQSKKPSLKQLLGKDAPPTINTRFNFGTRRQGEQCRTPLGEAGTCQFIFASQCSSILRVILQQGINAQVLAYLFQAIRSPCGFEGFDFTLCCADPNQPFQSTSAPTLAPTPAPTAAPTPAPTPAPSQDRCGVTTQNNRIVGGSEARQGAWPWAVILGRKRLGNGFQVMCGGTLVDEDTIVTAAHCFDSIPGQQGPNSVRLGDHDILLKGMEQVPLTFLLPEASNTLAGILTRSLMILPL